MTDHTDTIRPEAVHAPPWHVREDDFECYIVGKSGPGWYDKVADDVANRETAEWIVQAVNERESLLAERKQAIDERDELKTIWLAAENEGVNQRRELKQLQARCEQAIDALREIARDPGKVQLHGDARQIARAALLNLGEQP